MNRRFSIREGKLWLDGEELPISRRTMNFALWLLARKYGGQVPSTIPETTALAILGIERALAIRFPEAETARKEPA